MKEIARLVSNNGGYLYSQVEDEKISFIWHAAAGFMYGVSAEPKELKEFCEKTLAAINKYEAVPSHDL